MNAMAIRQNKNEKNLPPLHWYDIRWQRPLAMIHDKAKVVETVFLRRHLALKVNIYYRRRNHGILQ